MKLQLSVFKWKERGIFTEFSFRSKLVSTIHLVLVADIQKALKAFCLCLLWLPEPGTCFYGSWNLWSYQPIVRNRIKSEGINLSAEDRNPDPGDGPLHQASRARWSPGFGVFVGQSSHFPSGQFGLGSFPLVWSFWMSWMPSITQQEEGRVETLDWRTVKLLLSYSIMLHFLLFIDLLGSTRGYKLLYVGELIMHLGWIRAVKEAGTTHWKVDGQCPCFEKSSLW